MKSHPPRVSFPVLVLACLVVAVFLTQHGLLMYASLYCDSTTTAVTIGEQQARSIAAPQRSSKSSGLFQNKVVLSSDRAEYSSFVCLGGDQPECWSGRKFKPVDWSERRCVFGNVGLDADGTLVFHQDSNNLPLWDFTYGQAHVEIDPKTFLDAYGVHVRFVDEPIDSARYAQKHSRDTCFVFAQSGTGLSSIFSAFESMAATHMLSLSNEVVLLHATAHAPYPPSPFFSLISNRVRLKDEFRQIERDTLLPFVLLGNKKEQQAIPITNEHIARLFRDRTLELLGIESSASEMPRIGIYNPPSSKSPHAFTDTGFHQLLNRVRQKCSTRCEVAPIPGSDATLDERIRVIHACDILITPSDDSDLTSVFVKDGSTVVYLNTCFSASEHQTPKGQWKYVNGTALDCVYANEYYWTMFPYFHKESLEIFEASASHSIEWYLDRVGYPRVTFTVDEVRLERVIDRALERVMKTS